MRGEDSGDVFDFAPEQKAVAKDTQVRPEAKSQLRKGLIDPYTAREARKAAKRQEFLDIFERMIDLG
jgi:hypothetical protein